MGVCGGRIRWTVVKCIGGSLGSSVEEPWGVGRQSLQEPKGVCKWSVWSKCS